MRRIQICRWGLLTILSFIPALPLAAQSFRVQCPDTTKIHPTPHVSSEPQYAQPSVSGQNSTPVLDATHAPIVNGAIKCQEISGGDGFATMGDGHQIYLFGFGPLSGVQDIQNGLPGTEFATTFNAVNDPNGAIGLVNPATGAVDAAPTMNLGVLNANMPAPTMAIDEDDEFFLTLTNVGMIMRPDLFEEHTVHFHGYPNASSFYDGVPDASVSINIGGSFTYYYLAPDAGTYFWHCHITPPEHLQMGMVGQLYVRPRQNRVPVNGSLYAALQTQQLDLRTACNVAADILCSTPLPASNSVQHANDSFGQPTKYAYNDGDGSTRYDIDVPIQIHGFDPNFHFVGMTFNPEGFSDMKDKYFLLNGRSYPDTVNKAGNWVATPGSTGSPSIYTAGSDGVSRPSQPLPSTITLTQGQRALLRISDLDVAEFQTLASLGIPMQVIAINARLLRDMAGTNMYYTTNSITVGGGESIDVILDSCAVRDANFTCVTPIARGTYFLYTPQLDHLSNDAENFGGLMTEVVVQ